MVGTGLLEQCTYLRYGENSSKEGISFQEWIILLSLAPGIGACGPWVGQLVSVVRPKFRLYMVHTYICTSAYIHPLHNTC